MASPKILVVFYSRSGNTRSVATALAAELHADVEELADRADRSGVRGYLRSGREAFLRRTTQLEPLAHDPSSYDLVVVGTPVWNASLSSPVRTFLLEHGPKLRAVAFFLTHGRLGARRVFRQMRALAAKEPLSELAIRERDIEATRAMARFEIAVESALKAHASHAAAHAPVVH